MVTMEQLVAAGNALARALGHQTKCIKHSSMFPPCTCGAAQQQAGALDEWQHLTKNIDSKPGL